MTTYDDIIIVFIFSLVSLLFLFGRLNVTAQTFSGETQNLNANINAIKLSKPLKYNILLENAPRTIPILPLATIAATDLEDFLPVLSVNNLYEITQVGTQFFLSYPAVGGTTFSIQILSSPHPERVLKIIDVLRKQNIPSFDIQYGDQYGLFTGVFPNYAIANQYASSISELIFPTVGSTMSSWLIRQIP